MAINQLEIDYKKLVGDESGVVLATLRFSKTLPIAPFEAVLVMGENRHTILIKSAEHWEQEIGDVYNKGRQASSAATIED